MRKPTKRPSPAEVGAAMTLYRQDRARLDPRDRPAEITTIGETAEKIVADATRAARAATESSSRPGRLG